MTVLDLTPYQMALKSERLERDLGKVTDVVGQVIVGYVPGVSLGTVCKIRSNSRAGDFFAEVIGFRDLKALLLPLGDIEGVALGSQIEVVRNSATFPVGEELLGRVVNPLGVPLDEGGPLEHVHYSSIYSESMNPMEREIIEKPLDLGVKAINGLITVGRGQRVAIMAGSGVGKSVLLGMMARRAEADVNVIAMIGERGREVKEFITDILGPDGLKKSIIVVATSDQNALLRMRGAFAATTLAEYFARKGQRVLLLMDSVTRFAMAQREIALGRGEPPASKGYTPSVFALLPKLLERAGTFPGGGSITGLYTVLVEGDDMDDPIADAVRSIVDGHIVLDRKLAHRGHFPAIDPLQSTSRVMPRITTEEHRAWAQKLRSLLAAYKEAEDLISIGAYQRGANPVVDEALRKQDLISEFLTQSTSEQVTFESTLESLREVAD